MDKEKWDLFRRVVKRLVDDENFDPGHPYAALAQAILEFRDESHGLFLGYCLDVKKEHDNFQNVFNSVMEEQGIKIKRKSFRKRKSMVTPAMIEGARRAEERHQRVLGRNY